MSSARFRLGVDARAFSSPAGGVRRYVWEIYGALTRVAPDVDVLAIGAAPGDALPPGVRGRPATAFPTNLGWMAASIPLAVRGEALDVFHAPAYQAPLWGVHPLAVTIHDVSYERRPEWNAYKNDRARRWFYRRSALVADRIITDSEFSRAEIAAAYGIPTTRIDVVPLAAAASFTPGTFEPNKVPAGVKQPYALHVGDLHVRRNLGTALQAVLAARGRTAFRPLESRSSPLQAEGSRPPLESRSFRLQAEGSRISFVCAGIDRGTGDDLTGLARAANDPDALVLTGPVSEDALVNLYRGAAMLLYPSRYEGFGLPVLEAMSCGIPVIGANCASIPELVADAGRLLDPLDVPAWQSAIEALLDNPGMHARFSAAGMARASEFSWDVTARRTIDVLRQGAKNAWGRRR